MRDNWKTAGTANPNPTRLAFPGRLLPTRPQNKFQTKEGEKALALWDPKAAKAVCPLPKALIPGGRSQRPPLINQSKAYCSSLVLKLLETLLVAVCNCKRNSSSLTCTQLVDTISQWLLALDPWAVYGIWKSVHISKYVRLPVKPRT